MTLVNEELLTPGDPNSLVIRQEYEQNGRTAQIRVLPQDGAPSSSRWFRAQGRPPFSVEQAEQMHTVFEAYERHEQDRPLWLLSQIYEDIISGEPDVPERTVIRREHGVEGQDGWLVPISVIGGDLGIHFYARADHMPLTWRECVTMAREATAWYNKRADYREAHKDEKPPYLEDEKTAEDLMWAVYGREVTP